MKIKNSAFIAILLLNILIFTSCNNENQEAAFENIDTYSNQNISTSDENLTISEHKNATQATTIFSNETTTAEIINELTTKNDFNTTDIISIYKNAAFKSNNTVKSNQIISLKDISINDGQGAVNNMLKMIKPIISKIVEGNSTEFDGITGGYDNLSVTDLKTAEAYTKNGNTIIHLTMNNQTDGTGTDKNNGTVGHAISVIGDISVILNQLTDAGLPVEISNENIIMTYTEPTVDVVINNNGEIINGTWRYIVTLDMTNFSVAGSDVEKTSVVIENIISVNGGFSE